MEKIVIKGYIEKIDSTQYTYTMYDADKIKKNKQLTQLWKFSIDKVTEKANLKYIHDRSQIKCYFDFNCYAAAFYMDNVLISTNYLDISKDYINKYKYKRAESDIEIFNKSILSLKG